MKKLFTLLLALAMLSALLCGCGGTETATETPEESQSQTETETQTTDPAAETTDETTETGEQTESGEETTPAEKEAVVLEKDGSSEVKDQYRLSNVSADSGQSYSYLKGTDSDAAILSWEVSEGTTPVAVRVTVENLGKEAVNFVDEMGGILVTDSGKIYIATILQENPGQTAEDGNSYPSEKSVPLEKGQSAVLWLLCNVPTEVLNSGEGIHANFIMADNTSYDVDLSAFL